MRSKIIFVALMAMVIVAIIISKEERITSPEGQTLITVAGAIAKTNRPSFDPFEDAFLKFHEQEFELAFSFDREMLEDLGTSRATIEYKEWPIPITFEGPKLTDVLDHVGWQGKSVTVLALDGYSEEISKKDLESLKWIVAIDANGSPLGIGQRGPVWLVFPPPSGDTATQSEELRWPWAVFFIFVK